LGLLSPEVNHANADCFNLLVDRVPAVAVLVSPLFVLRVGGGAINLDAGPVLLVEVIQVTVARCLPYQDLAFSGRDAVRLLDAPPVADLEA
jgi:hypothetical protein